jgi:hypothetical protein
VQDFQDIPGIHDFPAIWCIFSIYPLQHVMNDKALANSAVAIIILNMSIGLANAIQLVGVAMMVRTVLLANQYNGDIGPSFSEKPWKSQASDLFDRCRRTYSSSNSSTDRYSIENVICTITQLV